MNNGSLSKKGIDTNWTLRLLQWICPDHLYEEIEGDLIQKFNKDLNLLGEKKAKRRLTWNVKALG